MEQSFQYTRESLIAKFKEISKLGWVKNSRPGNQGGIGNTLEDLLGVPENNLKLPDAGDWELKTHRSDTQNLLTLFHAEPEPRSAKIVPQILLLKYGWKHAEAGIKYPADEKSFRQTINAASISPRGFTVVVNPEKQRIEIQFDFSKITDSEYSEWKASVAARAGTGNLPATPYWSFSSMTEKIRAKLHRCFYAIADVKRIDGTEYYWYNHVYMLESFNLENFLKCLKDGSAYVDFDARTGHNHGTKFRIQQSKVPSLYGKATVVVDDRYSPEPTSIYEIKSQMKQTEKQQKLSNW